MNMFNPNGLAGGGGMMGNILMMSAMKENVGMGQLMFGMVVVQLITWLPVIGKAMWWMFDTYGARILIYVFERICTRFGMGALYRDVYEYMGLSKWVNNGVGVSVDNTGAEKKVKSSIFFQNQMTAGGSEGAGSKKKETDEEVQIIIQALNSHICTITDNRYVFFYKQYYSLMREPFLIAPNIWCQIQGMKETRNIELFMESYSITVFSYELELPALKKYVDDIRRRYEYEMNNQLGNQKFFFDEMHVSLPLDGEGKIRFDMAPKELTFSMTAFNTNKSFSNLFGAHLHILKERVRLFVENPKWYMERGIPHTLGVLLHGPPGTGKTSVIKAIAKDTRRHIFNIKLGADTTQTQLRNLFFKERIVVNSGGTNVTFNIPLDERIYVLEDVDCLTDVVYKRKQVMDLFEQQKEEITDGDKKEDKQDDKQTDKDDYNVIIPYNEIVGYADDTMDNYMDVGSNFTVSDVEGNKGFKQFVQDDDVDKIHRNIRGDKLDVFNEETEFKKQLRNAASNNGVVKLGQIGITIKDDMGSMKDFMDGNKEMNKPVKREKDIRGTSPKDNYMEAGAIFTISDVNKNMEIKPFKRDKDLMENGEKLNLAFLLNLLDGILETPNRILIMTTNHPEMLDDALVRAGRIDIKVNVGYCTIAMLKEMYQFFYGVDDIDLGEQSGMTRITPAEMNKICIDHFNDAEAAYKELVKALGK